MTEIYLGYHTVLFIGNPIGLKHVVSCGKGQSFWESGINSLRGKSLHYNVVLKNVGMIFSWNREHDLSYVVRTGMIQVADIPYKIVKVFGDYIGLCVLHELATVNSDVV